MHFSPKLLRDKIRGNEFWAKLAKNVFTICLLYTSRPAHTDFAEGLKATIDWYVANEAWWRPAKEATEARYRAQGQLSLIHI